MRVGTSVIFLWQDAANGLPLFGTGGRYTSIGQYEASGATRKQAETKARLYFAMGSLGGDFVFFS